MVDGGTVAGLPSSTSRIEAELLAGCCAVAAGAAVVADDAGGRQSRSCSRRGSRTGSPAPTRAGPVRSRHRDGRGRGTTKTASRGRARTSGRPPRRGGSVAGVSSRSPGDTQTVGQRPSTCGLPRRGETRGRTRTDRSAWSPSRSRSGGGGPLGHVCHGWSVRRCIAWPARSR